METFMRMLVLVHICGAVIGLLSGYLSMLLRKGSGLHRAAGDVFTVSMLTMSGLGAFLATFHKPNAINVIVGLLTFYLVSTGWWAGKFKTGRTGVFDYAAFAFVLADSLGCLIAGFAAAARPKGVTGAPAVAFFIFGSVALLFAFSDIRMLVRGGVAGSKRMTRHISRMGFALLIATLSFAPGQRFFGAGGRSPLLYAPHIFLILSMAYWRFRYRTPKSVTRQPAINVAENDVIAPLRAA